MGRADELMTLVEENEQLFRDGLQINTPLDTSDSYLEPGKSLLNLYQLMKLLEAAHGGEVAEDFKQYMLNGTPPMHQIKMLEFFSSRTDLISESICERLKRGY